MQLTALRSQSEEQCPGKRFRSSLVAMIQQTFREVWRTLSGESATRIKQAQMCVYSGYTPCSVCTVHFLEPAARKAHATATQCERERMCVSMKGARVEEPPDFEPAPSSTGGAHM